jgi:hypothetical protein
MSAGGARREAIHWRCRIGMDQAARIPRTGIHDGADRPKPAQAPASRRIADIGFPD